MQGRIQGGGHGGQLPLPSSGVDDVMLPWPRPSYYNYYSARTRVLELERSRVLPRQLQTTFFLDPWVHDGAYLAQRLLVQGCSLIASSRDRGCHLAIKRSIGNLNECGSGKKRGTYQPSSFFLDNQAKILPIPPENRQIPRFFANL